MSRLVDAQTFSFTRVTNFPGAFGTFALGFNNSGAIVGDYIDNNGLHSFLFSAGSFSTIEFPNATETDVIAISNTNEIVGFYFADPSSDSSPFHLHGFTIPGGRFDIPGAITIFPSGINDVGQIIGTVQFSAGGAGAIKEGFLLSNGASTIFQSPGAAGQGTFPEGINNAGQIVGSFSDGAGVFHGFLITNGTNTTIDFPGATATFARGINNNGDIVGNYTDSKGANHSFLLRSGTSTTFDFPDGSVPVGINDSGQVLSNSFLATPRTARTLAQPTNLKANQVSDASGTQIRLTWDYQNGSSIDGFEIERVPPSSFGLLSSPALSTGSELSVHPDPSICQSGHCTFVDRSFVTADNSALVPFATYSYRVRAFQQGSTDSDPSNVATCFQLRLETDNNNSTMQATFTPLATLTPNMNSLQQAAQLFHFDHFNWVSLMTHVPSAATLGLVDHNLNLLSPPPPPLIDPPLGGWLYRAADSLPYYWNEEAGFDPAYSLQQDTTNLATEFRDTPYSIFLAVSSDYFQFHTLLVGVEGAIGATPPRFHNLASFSWSSNFSKLSGGITDVRFSNIDPPTDPGPGGVFNPKTINDAELPLDVRQVLIQAGAQGVSTAPKVDTDAPTTAAFLFGPQGTNGWYTGPVMATLIATDIDGPSDVASTTYNIDGGPVLAYAGSFVISGDGIHTIQFGSMDQAGNTETPRPSQTIKIDATPPSISCVSNPSTLWPPDGKTVSVMVSGTISDSTSGVDGGSISLAVTDSEGQIQTNGPIALGSSGGYSIPVSLVASRFGTDKNGRKYAIVVTAKDNAGNINSCSTVVTVPHDQGHK